jgi:hypothetical protein
MLPTGWSANHAEPNWAISVGQFQMNNTSMMQAIGRIAKASGSVINTHRKNKEFSISPRYKASMWNIGTATMNKVLDSNSIRSVSTTYQPSPEYNGVYVSGINTGIQSHCIKDPTQGNVLAEPFSDDLVSHQDVTLAKGHEILNDCGLQTIYSFEHVLHPVGHALERYDIADLVEINVLGESVRGVVISTTESLSVDNDGVVKSSHTIDIETRSIA